MSNHIAKLVNDIKYGQIHFLIAALRYSHMVALIWPLGSTHVNILFSFRIILKLSGFIYIRRSAFANPRSTYIQTSYI